MSQLSDLIAGRSLAGVQFKSLDELGVLYGGLTGKSKADFAGGNARFVSYVNILNNLSTDVTPEDRVTVAEGERQNRVRYGDVLFTASSESANEVGMASGVTSEPLEPLYLNSFCFGFRPHNVDDLDPEFAKHLFRSVEVRKQIIRTSNGVTRINISKGRFREVKIPIPPPAIQREIALVLDKMKILKAQLESELESELELRARQYAFYRDQFLAFREEGKARWIPIGELCSIVDGTHQTPRYTDEGVPFVSVENIEALDQTKKFISASDFEKLYKLKPRTGDLLMTRIGSVGVCAVVRDDSPLAYYVTLALIRPTTGDISASYLRHVLESRTGRAELWKRTLHSAVPVKINLGDIGKLTIPVPSVEEQQRIVAILDTFDALVDDLSSSLPAEIAARRAQYEYYRDRLLAFDEGAAGSRLSM